MMDKLEKLVREHQAIDIVLTLDLTGGYAKSLVKEKYRLAGEINNKVEKWFKEEE